MNTNPAHIDKYELQTLLGKSGMAEVWKAIDPRSQRQVAIKLIHASLKEDPDFPGRFQREAQVVASLQHPNIIKFHEFSFLQSPGTDNITGYLVMDYIDGGNLASFIQSTSQQGKFPALAEMLRLFSFICAGVDYAHQHGVVHGKLKPSNVLLEKRDPGNNQIGDPVITDFGMLTLTGGVAGNGGAWFGLPTYTSPEQIMGNPAGPRGDIYALGVMLYELCTGTPPFPGNNPATIMMQHINQPPTLPVLINPALPPALTTIIMRCLAKDPAARFPDVSSLVAALAQGLGPTAQHTATVPSLDDSKRADSASGSVDVMPTMIGPGPLAASGPIPAAYNSYPPTELAAASGDQLRSPAYTPLSQGVAGTPQFYSGTQPGGPWTPALASSGPAPVGQHASYGPPPAQPPVGPPKRPARRGLWIGLSVLLVVLILAGSLGTYAFFSGRNSPETLATGSSISGYATFVSSELLSSDLQSNQGITDQMLIKLNNVSPPAAGMSYYAWLLNQKSQPWNPLALGELKVNNGSALLSYVNAQHTNLLSANSRFLITEESSATPPLTPSLSSTSWRYYSEFSEKKPVPSDPKSYSLYDHIKHLLANDPKVTGAGMSGGLDTWLYRDSEKILEWAGSARDAQKNANASSAGFIHRQLTRIMDFLDGSTYTQLSQDLPGQSVLADPTISKIGMLTFDASKQDPLGYLYHIGTRHLHEMVLLPEINSNQKSLAIQINQELGVVNAWYETMRADILQLNGMSQAQLLGSEGRTLLNAIANLANTAFVGQINSQGEVTPGIVQIHYDIQRLATFDIRACTASNPCQVV